MNRLLLLLLLTVASQLQLAAQEKVAPQPGQQVVQSYATSDGQTVNYLIFLPENYGAADGEKQKHWPLMIFLHGAGERGSDIELVKKWGPPKRVATDKSFPFVLVSPQCPGGQRWNIEHVKQLVEHVGGQHRVDKNRIYITGLSMGGFATWKLIAQYPDIFAAAVPICGGGNVESAERLTQIPIWAFHGDADMVVPLSASTKIVDAIKEQGGTKIKFTVYEGVGHNSWSETYANQDLYHWLLKQRRGGAVERE